MSIRGCLLLLCANSVILMNPAHAAFHVMQIEQVIGGLNGNSSAQAIQLRLRSVGQNQVQSSSLWAADAAGANRVLLLNIASPVANSAAGAHILLTTSAFTSAMVAGGAATFTPDFTLANAIPSSYLSAGRLTFEQDGGSTASPGTIYWSLSWTGFRLRLAYINSARGGFHRRCNRRQHVELDGLRLFRESGNRHEKLGHEFYSRGTGFPRRRLQQEWHC
jgi:hypothetical protein